ncbi:MAG: hypothetical protein JWM80_3913 [Cyanobacteria bacterium RYN_339]|nr:hypothetical protein [Cyanobacteria bacterium RYN_339]
MVGRVRQVWFYLRPDLAGEADRIAILNPAQQALFRGLALQDRAHALRVAGRLAGQDAPPYVIEAALLHDCGKPPEFTLVGRILGVLVGSWLDLPGQPAETGIRRQLQIYRWHDEWGLEAAQRAGTSDEALALLEAYQAKTPQPGWLGRLQVADDLG